MRANAERHSDQHIVAKENFASAVYVSLFKCGVSLCVSVTMMTVTAATAAAAGTPITSSKLIVC